MFRPWGLRVPKSFSTNPRLHLNPYKPRDLRVWGDAVNASPAHDIYKYRTVCEVYSWWFRGKICEYNWQKASMLHFLHGAFYSQSCTKKNSPHAHLPFFGLPKWGRGALDDISPQMPYKPLQNRSHSYSYIMLGSIGGGVPPLDVCRGWHTIHISPWSVGAEIWKNASRNRNRNTRRNELNANNETSRRKKWRKKSWKEKN